jgi:hypothetical protein
MENKYRRGFWCGNPKEGESLEDPEVEVRILKDKAVPVQT